MAQMLGYASHEMEGRHLFSFMNAHAARRFERRLERLQLGLPAEQDLELQRSDGVPLVVTMAVSPLIDEEGLYAGAIAGVMDVTERRNKETELRENEERFRSLADSIDEVLWCAEIGPPERIYASPAFDDIWGFSRNRLERDPRAWLRAVHPADRDRVAAAYESCRNEEAETFDEEYRIIRPDGSLRSVRHRGRAVCGAEGLVRRLSGIVRDVTERIRARERAERAERRLQQAQKLESLAVLTGGVAHEFNNILSTILGHAQLVGCTLRDAPDRRRLDAIQSAAKRAGELCEQMLTYAGQGSASLHPLRVAGVVDEVVEKLGASLPPTVALELTKAESFPFVKANASQIKRVVTNLVTNAVEAYGEEGGVVVVRFGLRWLSVKELQESVHGTDLTADRYAFVEVTDNGPGVDLERRERIFEPFFSTKFRGRGLGLAAALGIARGHGGTILLDSAPGRGSRFTVVLPLCIDALPNAERKPAPPLRDDKPRREGSRRVLFVDDEEELREIGEVMLERLGFEAVPAADGQEALRALTAGDGVQCAVVDLTMPVMDGAELLTRLREVRPSLPAIVVTGHGSDEAEARLEGLEVAQVLHKPFDLARLREALARAVGDLEAAFELGAPA
jgi:PAS domain S-box-containing protein